jgi:hypothetical protein
LWETAKTVFHHEGHEERESVEKTAKPVFYHEEHEEIEG